MPAQTKTQRPPAVITGAPKMGAVETGMPYEKGTQVYVLIDQGQDDKGQNMGPVLATGHVVGRITLDNSIQTQTSATGDMHSEISHERTNFNNLNTGFAFKLGEKAGYLVTVPPVGAGPEYEMVELRCAASEVFRDARLANQAYREAVAQHNKFSRRPKARAKRGYQRDVQ